MNRISILFLLLLSAGFAADAELSNLRSGISLVWGAGDGSDKGTAYQEEYLYWDKAVSDRKIVYIRDDTAITMSHNAFNNVSNHPSAGTNTGPFGYFRVIGANGLDGIPGSGDEGIIRYRVDREGQVNAFGWTSFGVSATFPAYTAPITFAGLTYSAGVPVVGTTGIGSGYQRGIIGPFGDEWHVIAVGDDDSLVEPASKTELQASDGKIYTFLVNPKSPAMTVRVTGNGRFYTTPAKVYLAPKIHLQTTYIQPGTGTVTFELRDIYGRNIEYAINGGSWVSVGADHVTLSDSDFASGSNSLDYRSVGYESYAKTRYVVKNPTHPSLAENHGNFLWGDGTELAKIEARITRAPYLTAWNNIKSTNTTFLNEWDANGLGGDRNPFYTSGYLYRVPLPTPQTSTAFVGLVNGFDSIPAGKSKTWGQYAKEQLLNSIWSRIDPVDYERNHSNGANPSTEVLGAGYYQVVHVFANVIAYDILAGYYRSDQNANGLDPIEDYYIRDVMASAVSQINYTLFYGQATIGVYGSEIGLWWGARSVGAMMTAMCLSEYSTPYYGTSGYGTVQTPYTYTPHPTWSPTWKEIYSTTPAIASVIPGTTAPSLTLDQSSMWQSNGNWGGPNLGYFDLMSASFSISANLTARYSPTTVYPYMMLGLQRGIDGNLYALGGTTPARKDLPLLGNSYLGSMGSSAVAALKAAGTESTSIRDSGFLGLIWYDDGVSGADTTAPLATGITVAAGGTTGTMAFNELIAYGGAGSSGLNFAASAGGALSATFGAVSGNSIPLTFSRTILQGTAITASYVNPGSGTGLKDLAGNAMADNPDITTYNGSTASAADTTAPSPNPPTLAGSITGADSVLLTVGACTDAGSAVLYEFSNDDGFTWSLAQSGLTKSYTGLTPGLTYSFRVRARDSAIVPNYTAASTAWGVVIDLPPSGSTQTHTSPRNRALMGF